MVLFNESLSFTLVYVVSFRISLAFTNTLSLNFSRNVVFQQHYALMSRNQICVIMSRSSLDILKRNMMCMSLGIPTNTLFFAPFILSIFMH